MERGELISIQIIAAQFVKFTKKSAILRCCIGRSKTENPIIQTRKFDKLLIKNIKNPDKILIGIETRKGSRTFTYHDGTEFGELFNWTTKNIK